MLYYKSIIYVICHVIISIQLHTTWLTYKVYPYPWILKKRKEKSPDSKALRGGNYPPICAAVSVWLPPFFPTLQHQQGPQDNAPNQSNTPTIKARRPIGPYVLRSAPGAFSLRGIYCKVGQTVNPYTQANLIQPILVKTTYTEHYNFITSIHNDCVMVV